jgi:hypothetical protein
MNGIPCKKMDCSFSTGIQYNYEVGDKGVSKIKQRDERSGNEAYYKIKYFVLYTLLLKTFPYLFCDIPQRQVHCHDAVCVQSPSKLLESVNAILTKLPDFA